MDIPRAICDAGVKAILQGKAIWGTENVELNTEEFTSALMAANLHEFVGFTSENRETIYGVVREARFRSGKQ